MDSTTSTLRSSSLAIIEKLCAALIPIIGLIEAVKVSLSGCLDLLRPHHHRPHKRHYSFDNLLRIAHNSIFTVNEVEALLELFKKLSSSIVDDGFIQKEELQLALLRAPGSENLFLDRVFDLFDEKKNGLIEFEEFVHVLGVFHPSAPLEDKIDFTFRLYDLRQTGYIGREEVWRMLNAILLESDIQLLPENLELIIDKTFADADVDKDGKINKEEWKAYAVQNPALLKNMTLPYLKDITTAFPSFIFNTEVDD